MMKWGLGKILQDFQNLVGFLKFATDGLFSPKGMIIKLKNICASVAE